MIFERTADQPHICSEEGGGECVAGETRIASAVEFERQGPGSIDLSASVEPVRSARTQLGSLLN